MSIGNSIDTLNVTHRKLLSVTSLNLTLLENRNDISIQFNLNMLKYCKHIYLSHILVILLQ